MSKRNKRRILHILEEQPSTASQIAKRIPARERPSNKEIGAWLRSQGVMRDTRRGGSTGGSIWKGK